MTSNEGPGRHTRRFDEQTRQYQSNADQGYPQQRPPFQDAGYQQSQESTSYIEPVYHGPVYDQPVHDQREPAQAYSQAAPDAGYPSAEPTEPAAPEAPAGQRIWPWIVLAVAAFAIGIIVGAAGMSTNKKSSASTPTVTVQAPPATETQTETVTSTPKTTTTTSSSSATTTTTAAAGASSFGDGTWMVGTQIKPGVYSTSGGTNCFWERLSGTSGDSSEIISGDNARGAATVTISSGDTAFKTQDCGTWTLTGH